MKRFFFITLVLALMAVVASCDKTVTPSVGLSADQAFGAEGTANIKISLSDKSVSDVIVKLEVGTEVSSGKALPAANLALESDMVVRAGELSASQTVSVKPDGLEAGEYTAVIRMSEVAHAQPSTGNNVVYIKYTLEKSDNGGSGNSGNASWVVSYEGYQEVETDDGYEWYEVFKVSGQGNTPIYFALGEEGTMESYKENLEGLYSLAEEWLSDDLEYYGDYGWTIDDFVVVEDPHYEYYNGMEAGTYELFAFGMTSEGKCTKQFAWKSITITEDHSGSETPGEDLEMVLQTNWSVAIVGDIYVDDDGDDVIDITVTAPGIKYYNAEENTQEDLDEYYGGSVAGLALSNQDYCQEYIDLYPMEDLMYYNEDPQTWMYVYNPGCKTTIYIVELDEDGMATGRYGATNVTLPGTKGLNSKLKIHIRK